MDGSPVTRPGRPDPSRRPYLGYRAGDLDTPFAKYFRPSMAPLAPHVADAVSIGARSPELLADLDECPALLEEEHGPVETGFAFGRDGSVRVSALTPMPGVSAEMWDWWFGWHGCDPRRYKLWHPQAHLYVEWSDGPDRGRLGRDRYVGRTSFVDECLGSNVARVAIQFVSPAQLGFDEAALVPGGGRTVVCARVGSSQFPMDIGHLVHVVRPAGDGAEMRSRFWLGGRHVRLRVGGDAVARSAGAVAGRLTRRRVVDARALLVHCAQEMSHLATFLPDLHREFGSE